MADYECILAYYDRSHRRGRCWLRLYQRAQGVTAVVSEVPGNIGPQVNDVLAEIATALVKRYALNPERLVVIEHRPPDSREGATEAEDEYYRARMEWNEDGYGAPERISLPLREVEILAGGNLAQESGPFWRQYRQMDWYLCKVGERRAVISCEEPERWRAIVTRDNVTVTARRGFESRYEAQFWALDTLANMANEYDTRPLSSTSPKR